MKKYSVLLQDVVKTKELHVFYKSETYSEQKIYIPDINRPALQLAGFYTYFDEKRLQVIGRVEGTYLEGLSDERRKAALMNLLKYNIPGLIFCHNVEPFPEVYELAQTYGKNILVTDEDTSTFIADLIDYLRTELAPRETLHGVLIEVHGEGLLIRGDSGIGKSETALELIKRGHRLIADDAVEIRRVSNNEINGTAPEIIRYYMELRGIGVIDVQRIFGVGAIKPSTNIDLIVDFEFWDDKKTYDRLGVATEYDQLLGVKLPRITIPVRQGRNLAVILELAAINNRQKKMGYNAAEELAKKYDKLVSEGMVD